MASDKEKRLRVHVVKEIYETEKDYTHQLEFTVAHILEKAREKGRHDNSFTQEIIQTLFCNIEEILSFHRQLVVELDACMGSKGPGYDTEIAKCYVNRRDSFVLYQRYGESNEQAQKLLYELYDSPAFKAFFVACMLLGGKSDEDISGLVFKPIQRVCKYPLLFRELSKYTHQGHPDYGATQDAQLMMKDVCSVINEAKRRVEKLEAIADWQAMVEGWEGTNVVDTCNELVKEGPLIKISAGNTQERQFYLFDNLLVYCKKTTQLLSGSKSRNKGILFRGRVPVSSLDIEDIADGTADYYTNGIAVNNSWKVHNIAKNKWFVLVAKSAEEKQIWMDAIRREKEKRKRQAAGIAQNNRALALDKGEKIYYNMRRDKVMKDHKARFRTYSNTFTGQEFVKWLVDKNEVADNDQAVLLGQALLENGVIHHVTDRHQFKNDRDLLYRFRYDDGTFRNKLNSSDLTARGIRIYCRLHGLFDTLIKEQKIGLRSMKCVINSQKMIDWWQAERDIQSRQGGVDLGQEFFATGFLRHATDEQNFKDGTFLYRFTADDGHEGPREKESQRKLTAVTSKIDFNAFSVGSCRTIRLPYLELDHNYGVELEDSYPVTVKSVAPEAQIRGVCVGQKVVAINGQYTSLQNLTDLLGELAPDGSHPPSLTLLVSRPGSSEYAVLVPSAGGLGFHIKGSSPVIIHNIDKGSSAAQAGVIPGCCILKVGDEDVLRSSHDSVVAGVKASLLKSKEEQGKASVRLKLSFPFLEQLACYKYECADTTVVEVYERTVESPYTFSLPAQLLKLYAEEADHVISLVSGSGVTDERVTKYLEDLKALSASYMKMSTILSLPRWPSYKLHGTANSAVLEACPTNLHTSILDVVTGATPSPPTSPVSTTSARSSVSQDEDSPDGLAQTTGYLVSTMAVPSLSGKNITASKSDRDVLTDVQTRRELLTNLRDRVTEMDKDFESIKMMICEIHGSPIPSSHTNGGINLSELSLSSSFSNSLNEDLTPNASPVLSARHRIISISNPEPVLKLVVEGLLQKSEALSKSLDDKLLLSVLEEASGILVPTVKDVIAQFRERLTVLCEEVRACAKRPGEPLNKSVSILIDATHKYIQDLRVRLWISLALCDNTSLLQTRDRVFSQCLTSVVTSFAHSLLKACRGQLNPGVEYDEKNREASSQWLQMIAKKGVLVHLQSTLLPKETSEMSALKDLNFLQSQLSSVVFHIREADASGPQHLACTDLPPVTIDGSRDNLHVLFHLPKRVYEKLPNSILSESGVKVVPILFNKGLVDIEEGSEAYGEERSINMQSFKGLKNYYQALRGFRLDKSNLPSDSDAKTVAVTHISQPLNAMDILIRQVEVAVREPTRPGVGLLTLAAEVTTRMGAVRINVCDSGVFRSGMATSLEQVMVLGRCHGLSFKSFRSTLNRLRRRGGFSYIVRKNNADISKSLPVQPPKLYQLPPEATDT